MLKPKPSIDPAERLPHPDDLPDLFATTCVGDCLSPVIEHNACLIFDKREPVQNGDFVVFYFRPGFVPAGEHPAMVKRLVSGAGAPLARELHPDSEVSFLILAEMLNPPKTLRFKSSDVEAMIKCVGLANSNGDGTGSIMDPQPEWASIDPKAVR